MVLYWEGDRCGRRWGGRIRTGEIILRVKDKVWRIRGMLSACNKEGFFLRDVDSNIGAMMWKSWFRKRKGGRIWGRV